MIGIVVAAAALAVPLAVFVGWPFVRRRGVPILLALPPDPREPFLERKASALRALREIDFEHEAGHVSDDDYGELRARYESETATVLSELDRLGLAAAPTPPAARASEASARGAAWRHPLALASAAMALVAFGVTLGVGIVRYSEPDRMAGAPMPGSSPLASLEPPAAAGGGSGRTIPPEVLRGMLQAARQSLFAGRPQEASAAYQAVLKRDPQNVDALSHLGLLLVMSADGAERGSELVDHGLRLFDRALAIDATYGPALFYRGQVLYEVKHDAAGAIASWEKFVAVAPPGEDRDRVVKMIADTKAALPKR